MFCLLFWENAINSSSLIKISLCELFLYFYCHTAWILRAMLNTHYNLTLFCWLPPLKTTKSALTFWTQKHFTNGTSPSRDYCFLKFCIEPPDWNCKKAFNIRDCLSQKCWSWPYGKSLSLSYGIPEYDLNITSQLAIWLVNSYDS